MIDYAYHQKATIWRYTGFSKDGSGKTYGSPISITCAYGEVNQRSGFSSRASERLYKYDFDISRTMISTATQISEGDMVLLGSHSTNSTPPTEACELVEVKQSYIHTFNKTYYTGSI